MLLSHVPLLLSYPAAAAAAKMHSVGSTFGQSVSLDKVTSFNDMASLGLTRLFNGSEPGPAASARSPWAAK